MQRPVIPMEAPPYGLSGVVYGTLLNHQTAWDALGGAMDQSPYKAPPKAPVLYMKPRNTLLADGGAVELPAGASELEIGACLGLVIGRPACRLAEANALDYVAGYVIVADVSIPHQPYFRPSVSAMARDGFCPIGPRVVPRISLPDPDHLTLRVFIDGSLKQQAATSQLRRPVRRLLADVTEFMTLSPGDVLAVGAAAPAPRVHAGQQACIEIDGIGRLCSSFVQATP